MRRHDPADFVVPEQLWERAEMDAVLRARDAGGLFQLIRKYAGASQTGLTIRTGIAKSEISAIMAGHRRVTSLDRFESIADGLDMPDTARAKLGLAPRRPGPQMAAQPLGARAAAPERLPGRRALGRSRRECGTSFLRCAASVGGRRS